MRSLYENVLIIIVGVGLNLDAESMSDRKILQKVVFLAQSLGFPPDYQFAWHINGPYSPQINEEYRDIVYELNRRPTDIFSTELSDNYDIHDDYFVVLENIKKMISAKPQDASLSDWVETLASVAFLRDEAACNRDAIRRWIEKDRAHLLPYCDLAEDMLDGIEGPVV